MNVACSLDDLWIMTGSTLHAARSPLVSVIVPAFNSAQYLGAALASLRVQTISDIEIIVVDDASTDGTRDVANEHAEADPRVRVLTRAIPSGRPACARNEGLAAARGRYIAFLDADDTSVPNRLESATRAMELTGAQFAFADMRRFHQDSGVMEQRGTLEEDGFLSRAESYLQPVSENVYLCAPTFPASLLTYGAINTPTVVFDRALLSSEPMWFDESLIRFEDVDLWFRLAEHTRFVFVNAVHAIVRKHAASITAVNRVDTRIDGVAVRRRHLARLRARLSKLEIAEAEQNISELQFHVAYAEWCSGRDAVARQWFRESWKSKPTSAAALSYIKAFAPRSYLAAVKRAFGHRAS